MAKKVFQTTICLYLIVEVITSAAILPSFLHIRGGSESSYEGEKLSGYQDMRQWYHGNMDDGTNVMNRRLDKSDDFYLDSVSDITPVPIPTIAIADPIIKDDKVYYDAVDYQSASSTYTIPQQYRKKSKKKNKKTSFTDVFRVFVWKGFGLSFEKSVIQWNAFGSGVSVPITSNFPEWEKNTALPKLSTTFGLNYPFGCKMSLSVSIPLNTALYGVMTVGKLVSGTTPSPAYAKCMDKLKKQKASSSVKRVGITATIKYNKAKGFFMYVGPSIVYYPGLAVMQYLLPIIFSFPAIFVTLLGLFLQLDTNMNLKEEGKLNSSKVASNITPFDTIYSRIKVMIFGNSSNANFSTNQYLLSNNTSIPSYIPEISPSQISPSVLTENIPLLVRTENNERDVLSYNKIKQIPKIQKKKSNSTTGNKIKKWKRPKGFLYWHKRILIWASIKKTGLGYNMKMNYKSLTDVHDASLGSRVVFEIGTFKPFPKTFSKLYQLYTTLFFPQKLLLNSKISLKDTGGLEPMSVQSINDYLNNNKGYIHTLTQSQRDILENALKNEVSYGENYDYKSG